MPRASFPNVLSIFLIAAAMLYAGPVMSATAATAKSPAMEAMPAAPGEAPRIRVRTPPSRPAPTKNIYETLSADKDVSKFMEMVNSAELKSLFVGNPDSVITVFVPNNKAMEAIPANVMKRIDVSKGSKESFIEYHVILNAIVTNSALKGRKTSPASASGETLVFDGLDKKNPPKVNDGNLVGSDIAATNGIIHIVSSAVVPPSILKMPKSALVPAPPPSAPATVKIPSQPAAPTVPQAPVVSRANLSTTTTASTAMKATTSAPALNSTVTGSAAIQSTTLANEPTGAAVTTTAVPQPPAQAQPVPQKQQAPADSGDQKGITLFGHKFSW